MKINRIFLLTIAGIHFISAGFAQEHHNHHEESEGETSERLFSAGKIPDRVTQSITEDPSTQIALSWRVMDSVNTGYAEYLPLSAGSEFRDNIQTKDATQVPVEFEGVTDHYFHVKLGNLQADTKYQVRVGGKDYRSEWFHVQTAPESFEPFSFLHFAGVQHDIMEFGPRVYRTAFRNFPDVRFTLHSGDIVQARGGDNDWGELSYAGSWMFSEIPVLPAAGNSDHWEMITDTSEHRILYPQWNGVFNLPDNHPPNLENLAYYSDFPGVRVITLYSGLEAVRPARDMFINKDVKMTREIFNKQMEWLEKILAENNQPWTVVHLHHPILSARVDRSYEMHKKFLKPILEKYQVDLVLQGHEHLYARGYDKTSKTPFPVYVTSKAGPRSKEIDPSRKWLQKTLGMMQLYQVVHLSPQKLKVEAYNLKGDLVDAFEIRKDDQNRKKLIDQPSSGW
jgi:hypothetical protein